jgi:hypothetical protein
MKISPEYHKVYVPDPGSERQIISALVLTRLALGRPALEKLWVDARETLSAALFNS